MVRQKRFVPAILCICACPTAFGCGDRGADASSSQMPRMPSSDRATPLVRPQVRAALDTNEDVDVIVNFRDPAPESVARNQEEHRASLRRMREAILARVPAGFVAYRLFESVPAVAGRMSRAALEVLSTDPNVESIQVDGMGSGALLQAVPAIQGDVAKKTYGVSGKGVRVALLDSGVSSTHPDLKASLVSTQHCFTRNACPPNSAAEGTSAEDDNGHGSHVAGVVTADGIMNKVGPGFAPDAEIVAVKVDDKNDSGFISDWIAGLDWVASNLSTLRVKIVNMSVCTKDRYATASECDAQQPGMARAVKNLTDAGVTLFAASGNMADKEKLSSPACNTGVIAVGATYKIEQGKQPESGGSYSQWTGFGDCSDATTAFDQVACFSNSGPRLDLVAPGAVITSAFMGSTQYGVYRGTSQASPAAAGVAALMLQCNPNLKPVEVKDILVRTAATVKDARNGLVFPSIRADRAVKEACAATTADGGVGGANGRGGALGAGGAGGSGGLPGLGGSAGAGGLGAGGAMSATGGSAGNGGSAGRGGSDGATPATTGGRPGNAGQVGAGGGATSAAGGSALASSGGMTAAAGGKPSDGGQVGIGGATSAMAGGASAGMSSGKASGNSGCGCAVGAPFSPSAASSTLVLVLALVLGRTRRRRSERKRPSSLHTPCVRGPMAAWSIADQLAETTTTWST